MAGTVFGCIEIFAGFLFLLTRDEHGNGYYPSTHMVSPANFLQPDINMLCSLTAMCLPSTAVTTKLTHLLIHAHTGVLNIA